MKYQSFLGGDEQYNANSSGHRRISGRSSCLVSIEKYNTVTTGIEIFDMKRKNGKKMESDLNNVRTNRRRFFER
jgi:hypothetical protein